MSTKNPVKPDLRPGRPQSSSAQAPMDAQKLIELQERVNALQRRLLGNGPDHSTLRRGSSPEPEIKREVQPKPDLPRVGEEWPPQKSLSSEEAVTEKFLELASTPDFGQTLSPVMKKFAKSVLERAIDAELAKRGPGIFGR